MQERILYLKGAACPFIYTKVFSEEARHQKEIRRLARNNVQVISIGSSVDGFSLLDVEDTFKEFKDIDTVIVDAHGDDKRNRHNIVIGRDTENNSKDTISAGELYETMAKSCGQRPLKIFMFSCGSGDGHTAVHLLPAQSTVFSLAQPGISDCYLLHIDGYNVPTGSTQNFAERFFLNILFNGLDSQSHYTPQIAVNSGKPTLDNVWALWDVAQKEFQKGDMLKRCMENGAPEFFNGYMTADDIAQAIKEFERITQRLARSNSDDYFTPSRPLSSSLNGQICAISYLLNQKQIGAFHSQTLQYGENIETASAATEFYF